MAQVVIIGGAVAGMALALALKKQNISSAIYELRDEDYSGGDSIVLAPNCLRALDAIGCYERIRTKGFNYSSLTFQNAHGVKLGTLLHGSQKRYTYDAMRLHRNILLAEMRAEVEQQGISITYGKKCTEVNEDADGVTVTFADGESVKGEFVIGADGIHSSVRQHISTEKPKYEGVAAVLGHVDASQLKSLHGVHIPGLMFGPNGLFGIIPSSYSGDQVAYFSTCVFDEQSREGWAKMASPSALRAMLGERFATRGLWSPLVEDLVDKTAGEDLLLWPVYSAPYLEQYHSPSGRVILIGDAAHAIPPTGGQGAAMALEDAVTLAYALSLSLASADRPSDVGERGARILSLVEQWEGHRRERVKKVTAFTSQNKQRAISTTHPVQQYIKEWVIWGVFKWFGEEFGVSWIYNYHPEDVRKVLSS